MLRILHRKRMSLKISRVKKLCGFITRRNFKRPIKKKVDRKGTEEKEQLYVKWIGYSITGLITKL